MQNSHHPVTSSSLGIIKDVGFSPNSPLPAVSHKPKHDTAEFSPSLLKSTDMKTN